MAGQGRPCNRIMRSRLSAKFADASQQVPYSSPQHHHPRSPSAQCDSPIHHFASLQCAAAQFHGSVLLYHCSSALEVVMWHCWPVDWWIRPADMFQRVEGNWAAQQHASCGAGRQNRLSVAHAWHGRSATLNIEMHQRNMQCGMLREGGSCTEGHHDRTVLSTCRPGRRRFRVCRARAVVCS